MKRRRKIRRWEDEKIGNEWKGKEI